MYLTFEPYLRYVYLAAYDYMNHNCGTIVARLIRKANWIPFTIYSQKNLCLSESRKLLSSTISYNLQIVKRMQLKFRIKLATVKPRFLTNLLTVHFRVKNDVNSRTNPSKTLKIDNILPKNAESQVI